MTTRLLDHFIAHLEHVRARRPELRFGQLMAIVGTLAEDETGHSLWDVEDAEFTAALERFAADVTRGESKDAEPLTRPTDLNENGSPRAS